MTLEDFEKSLAQSRSAEDRSEAVDTSKKRRHHHHHRSSRSQHSSDRDEDRHRHRHKRSRRFDDEPNHIRRDRHSTHASSDPEDNDEWVEKEVVSVNSSNDKQDSAVSGAIQRDSWMEAPSSHEVHVRKAKEPQPEKMTAPSSHPAPQLKIHKNELNIHLQGLAAGKEIDDIADEPAQREVDYAFGDSGSQWRMTKLKGVLRQAEDTGRSVEDIAVERYGDLRAFDEAREEQIELDRRETYGSGYVGKEKPGGELFQERNLQMNLRRDHTTKHPEDGDMDLPQAEVIDTQPAPTKTVQMDQTALNRLKAQMMKAKLRGSPDLPALEAEYSLAMSTMSNRKASDVVVLGAMENRMLAGGRRGEVKATDNKRGRERGLVEENEDMSIEDMVREERRTKGQAGGDGQRFAERIAKDAKFDNDLDYLDENASKLAKRVQKSEVNLKNTAISDFQKMSRILDNCPLCHHEDKDLPPMAPLVSLATRVYLTLPTDPEISEGGACIVPIQHRGNLLECDDDEWEEIRVWAHSYAPLGMADYDHLEFHEVADAHVPRSRTGCSILRECCFASEETACCNGGRASTVQPWRNGAGLFQGKQSRSSKLRSIADHLTGSHPLLGRRMDSAQEDHRHSDSSSRSRFGQTGFSTLIGQRDALFPCLVCDRWWAWTHC